MGFINLITIDDYIQESEKYIYEVYGLEREELQNMQEEDFRKLADSIIKKYIKVEYCKDSRFKWMLAKTDKGIEIAYEGGIDRYINCISKQYGRMRAEGEINKFLDVMKSDIIKVVVGTYNFVQYDMWCEYYLMLRYTLLQNNSYDAYENTSYFSSVEIDDLPFSFPNGDSFLPMFGRILQRNLYKEKIYIFSKLYGKGNDITRYGFKITQSIIDSVEKELKEEAKSSIIEELLLIDKVMGVSLTNIFFWYTKSAPKEKWDSIIKLSKKVSYIKNIVIGNLIGEMVCVYMLATKFDNEIMNQIDSFLDSNVYCFNKYFNDLERINLVSSYDEGVQEEILTMLEGLLLKSGYFISDEEIIKYSFFKMNKIKDMLRGEERIKVSKIKRNKYELYASIHRAVMQGIVEKNKGSAKK